MNKKPFRVAYLVSHPIQYQAPLLRLIASHPAFEMKVFFLHNSSANYFDPGFGRNIAWDTPLLDGYDYETLPAHGPKAVSFWHGGLSERLRPDRFNILWTHGYSHPTNARAIAIAHRRGIKVLMRGESTLKSGSDAPLRKALKLRFLRWCFPRCAGFLSIGAMNREFYRAHGIGEDRLFEVPYAVDNEFFQGKTRQARPHRESLRESLGLEPGRPIILFAGKLLPHKRPADLLEAYTRLSADGSEPHPYLLFAGSGVEQERLAARVAATGWGSVRLLGFQNQTELPRLFDLCDLFVLPSDFEPWGLVVNEVMNAGKALLVSDAAGCAPDLVVPGGNGWLFRAGDIESLAAALRTALRDPGQLAVMGRRSLGRIGQWSFREDVEGLIAAATSVLRS